MMPWLPCVHRPPGWRDKRARDQDYAVHRNPAALALMTTQAWRKARRELLVSRPWCVGCGGAASVVDHRDPHRGDPVIFWDKARWQPLCASCHSRKTAAEDGGFGNRRRGMAPR